MRTLITGIMLLLTQALAAQELSGILNVPQGCGWLVQHVVRNSPAELAGLKGGFRSIPFEEEEILLGGDIILSVDGIRITGPESIEEVMDHLDQLRSATTHEIRVLRAGEEKDFYWVSGDL